MGMFGIGSIFQEVGNMIRDDKAIVNGWLNNAWSARQNKKAWERNLWLSNTAHQREVEDLRSAGLNPVLSAGQGASAPASLSVSSVMGQGHTSAPDFGSAFARDATSLIKHEADKSKADVEKIKAETKKIEAEAEKSKAESIPAQVINKVSDKVKTKLKEAGEFFFPSYFGNGGRNSAGSIEKIDPKKINFNPDKPNAMVNPIDFYFDKKGMYQIKEGRKVYIDD